MSVLSCWWLEQKYIYNKKQKLQLLFVINEILQRSFMSPSKATQVPLSITAYCARMDA